MNTSNSWQKNQRWLAVAAFVIVFSGLAIGGTPDPKDFTTPFVVENSEHHVNRFGSYDPGAQCTMWVRSSARAYFVEQHSKNGLLGSCRTFYAGVKLMGRVEKGHVEILDTDKHDNPKVQKYKIRMTSQ